MKKFIISLLFAAAGISCAIAQQVNIVKGNIKGLSTDKLWIAVYPLDTLTATHARIKPFSNFRIKPQETVTAVAGKFEVEIPSDSPSVMLISPDEGFFPDGWFFDATTAELLLMPGEKVKVTGKLEPGFLSYDVSGGGLNPAYAKARKSWVQGVGDLMRESENASESEMRALSERYQEILEKTVEAKYDFIRRNPGHAAIGLMAQDLPLIPSTKEILDSVDPANIYAPLRDVFEYKVKKAEASELFWKAAGTDWVGETAPDFTLMDRHGDPFMFSSLRGKYVVLDFWGSWCAPCIQGIPVMRQLHAKCKGKNVEFIHIACNDTEEAWRKALDANPMEWIQVLDDPGLDGVKMKYGIFSYPTKIIVDPQGKIVFIGGGENEVFYSAMQELFGVSVDKKAAVREPVVIETKLKKGDKCPGFTYEDPEGNKVSLGDLEGKYVLVDVWATWCGPCKGEIPALKALEEKYRDRNIHFLSLSVDEDVAAWRKMVSEDGLTGIQLNIGGDRSLVEEFEIMGIPRFILLDRTGHILDPMMRVRPSNPEIAELLESLPGF